MLNLTGEFHYFFCSEAVTLRYRHRGLREYIKSHLHKDPTNGDVFIFLAPNQSRVRIYYFHHKGEVLTEKILHSNRFMHPVFEDNQKLVHHISWHDFVYLIEGIIRTDRKEYFDDLSDENIEP